MSCMVMKIGEESAPRATIVPTAGGSLTVLTNHLSAEERRHQSMEIAASNNHAIAVPLLGEREACKPRGDDWTHCLERQYMFQQVPDGAQLVIGAGGDTVTSIPTKPTRPARPLKPLNTNDKSDGSIHPTPSTGDTDNINLDDNGASSRSFWDEEETEILGYKVELHWRTAIGSIIVAILSRAWWKWHLRYWWRRNVTPRLPEVINSLTTVDIIFVLF
jgi:hypothetical protein